MRELNVKPLPERLIGRSSMRIMNTANKLGFDMEPMPKFINPKKCVSCGLCILGCKTNAKWSSINFIQELQRYGSKLVTGIDVQAVVVKKKKAIGLIAKKDKQVVRIYANKIVLSAGGYGSAIVLKKSGIDKAGNSFFVDLFNVTYGILRGIRLYKEPAMTVLTSKFLEKEGFIISPFVDMPIILKGIIKRSLSFNCNYSYNNLIGIMTKVKDDHNGKIMVNGRFTKSPTEDDFVKLHKGSQIAKEILMEMGVKKKDIFVTAPRGAHPGGTASIGKLVDNNLRTEIENLYVCDASVLPMSSGAPPIITIISLGKRLSRFL
jgi:choline dehydrogenase-like flavoprotein